MGLDAVEDGRRGRASTAFAGTRNDRKFDPPAGNFLSFGVEGG